MTRSSVIAGKIRSSIDALTELVYPGRCVHCRRLGSYFCQNCRSQTVAVGDDICIRCGQPTSRRCTCHFCQTTPPDPLRAMRGVVFYGGSIDSAIQALKYEDLKQLAAPLAIYLIDYLENHPIPFDALVPVPLHPDRLTIRGYNQSDLLAERVGKARSIPVRTDLIIRTRDTKPQVHLKRSERLENVHQAFEPAQAAALDGETILLIDDVCTTGATLIACAEALQLAGAGDIWALTVARARPPIDPEPWQEGLNPTETFIAWDGGHSPKLDTRHVTHDT